MFPVFRCGHFFHIFLRSWVSSFATDPCDLAVKNFQSEVEFSTARLETGFVRELSADEDEEIAPASIVNTTKAQVGAATRATGKIRAVGMAELQQDEVRTIYRVFIQIT